MKDKLNKKLHTEINLELTYTTILSNANFTTFQ